MFQRYLQGMCSPAEVKVLLQHFNAGENERQLKTLIRQHMELDNEQELNDEILKPLLEKTYENVRKAISTGKQEESKSGIIVPMMKQAWFRVASAVLIIFLSAGAWFYFSGKTKEPIATTGNKQQPFIDEIMPGGEKATLTLADGSTIILDNAANGELANQGNTKVVKLNDGQLSYNSSGKNSGEILYNTMSTPRGGQYKLLLPDGSRVWLNAASSIRYPTAFTGNERKVQITGEAYFEIKPLTPTTGGGQDKVPFIVKINSPSGLPDGQAGGGMEVQVLGTHFNVNAYGDEASIKTTLLEGSVKINKRVENGVHAAIIKPGEQAQVMNDNSSPVRVNRDIDMEEIMAWKNGSFIFNSQDIESIMRQISRWYDVDVSYQGERNKEAFSGMVSRGSHLSQVLKIVEAGGVKFKIEGKKIIVMQ